jgi:hypothetical protein
VIDDDARKLEGLTRDGVRLGGTEEPFDAVVLATGFRPGLEELFEEASARRRQSPPRREYGEPPHAKPAQPFATW